MEAGVGSYSRSPLAQVRRGFPEDTSRNKTGPEGGEEETGLVDSFSEPALGFSVVTLFVLHSGRRLSSLHMGKLRHGEAQE